MLNDGTDQLSGRRKSACASSRHLARREAREVAGIEVGHHRNGLVSAVNLRGDTFSVQSSVHWGVHP